MKAVVLVGGLGTRLRPLTETIPKPLLPLVDRALLDHILDHLAEHGVHDVLLSSPHRAATFDAFIRARRRLNGHQRISRIPETIPLGTGGAIVNAVHCAALDESFLVLNGDTLTNIDLTALAAFHRRRRAVATIALTQLRDPRPYGLVVTDRDANVLEFREKPDQRIAGTVSAGTYVLEPSALDGMEPGRLASVERDLFPTLVAEGAPMTGYASNAYWMDLGTPQTYLKATFDVLNGRVAGLSYPAPFIAPDARVAAGARVGARVVVSSGCVVEAGATVDDSVLLAGSTVEAGAELIECIIGPGARVGQMAALRGAVVAGGARVPSAPNPS